MNLDCTDIVTAGILCHRVWVGCFHDGVFEIGDQNLIPKITDPLHVRGNAANLEDRTIKKILHENGSQFPEEKISFALSSRLAAFP